MKARRDLRMICPSEEAEIRKLLAGSLGQHFIYYAKLSLTLILDKNPCSWCMWLILCCVHKYDHQLFGKTVKSNNSMDLILKIIYI